MPRERPAPYVGRMDDRLPILREHGGLAVLLVDLTSLGRVDLSYGSRAYTEVLDSATPLILELSGTRCGVREQPTRLRSSR